MNTTRPDHAPESSKKAGTQTSDATDLSLVQKVGALQAALEASERTREQMLRSNSWRMTAPVRWVRRRLAAVRHGNAEEHRPVEPPGATGMAAFPATVRAAPGSRPDGPNDTFHPLDFDLALAPLFPLRVSEGRLVEAGAPNADRYFGTSLSPLRLAFLGSEELQAELAFDAVVTPLRRGEWEQQVTAGRHDFLLIETAWDPAGNWRYALLGSGDEGAELRRLLDKATAKALPIVLWFREEAENLHHYAWLAERAEIVYGVDEDKAEHLRRHLPRARVGVLPPGIQPALHSPVRSYCLRDASPRLRQKVLLDGWWDLASGVGTGTTLTGFDTELLLAESRWDVSRIRVDDLPNFRGASIGCVTPLEKSALSRLIPLEIFLHDSLTPAWRRRQMMMQAAACGAVVLAEGDQQSSGATPAFALRATMEGLPQLARSLLGDPLALARRAHLAFREIVSKHCLADRLGKIAADLELGTRQAESPGRVAVLLVTMRPERLESCLEWFRRERYPDREMVVVLHGDANVAAARRLLRPGEPIQLLHLGRERSLGDCLNFAVAHTDAPYWIKMDDDDHYGANYLSDLMLYRRVSDAPLFGKPPMFLHLEEGDELCWDPLWAQHANLLHSAAEASSALVAGGALGGRREVLEQVRFSATRRGGSDSDFIRRCYSNGFDLLATDGFNFARFRSAREGFHTWKAPVAELRERSDPIGSGADLETLAFI